METVEKMRQLLKLIQDIPVIRIGPVKCFLNDRIILNMRILAKFIFYAWIFFYFPGYISICESQTNSGTIIGSVTDMEGTGLSNVNIVIVNTQMGTASDKNGNFRIENMRPGEYTLRFSNIGYRTETRDSIVVAEGREVRLNIKLQLQALLMQEIVVTPGNFSISQNQTARRQIIQKEKITSLPATIDDIYRVLQIMPGVSFSDDFSAHFHVRGGKQNENLILLDGMEIFDPYHLKNIGGAVGVMNMDLIENVTILTGGFPAKYGDKLSSVVVIENREAKKQKFGGSFGVGGTGAKMTFESNFSRANLLLSFRKSFIKEAVEILNPTNYSISPSFYDAQSKLTMKINANNQLIANVLYSKDKTYLEKWRGESNLSSNYGNGYYGLVWKSIAGSKMFSELVISKGENFWDNRIGPEKKEKLNLTENVVNWNLNFLPNRSHDINLGITYKNIHYKYELKTDTLSQNQQNFEDVLESFYGDVDINSTTYKLSAYLQNKFRILNPLTANIGIRYDYFEYNKNQQWSPRVGLAYRLSAKTVLRSAYGFYYQAPAYTELTSVKGADVNPEAQRAIHYVIGIEHFFNNNLNIRIEGYQKSLSRMIGHYISEYIPGQRPVIRYGNPYDGLSKGIELFVNGKINSQLFLWFTYSYSKTRIEASFINWQERILVKRLIPRITDQPHNLSFFINYLLPKNWQLNLKWRYLTGIPYTPYNPIWDRFDNPRWQYGEVYSARYPDYHRLDIRLGKRFIFSSFNLWAFLEIKNVYNRNNVLLYNHIITDNKHNRREYHTLPFLPSIEFNITF